MTVATPTKPAAFLVQPGEYHAADAGDITRWERELIADLGLDIPMPTAERKEWVRGETISGSGNGWDDSDYVG